MQTQTDFTRYIFPAVAATPAILLIVQIFSIIAGRNFLYELGISPLFGILPILSFCISVAVVLVFPKAREWRVAALINAAPLGFLLLLGLLWTLVGYH